MTKYTKDALMDYLLSVVIALSTGMTLALSVTLFGIDKVMIGLGVAVFLFCSYKYIKIQSELNERLDNLKNKYK